MAGSPDSREVSRILREAARGRPVDMDALMPLVYGKLREIAAQRLARERAGHTLQTTALVNEAYLRLVGREDVAWESRAHFYAAAAASMRRILIDHARARGAAKRGGGAVRLPLDVVDLAARENLEDIVSVDEAVSRLEGQDARMAEIVQLRFYAGLTEKEVAQALGVTDRTIRNDWVLARAWLRRELSKD